MTEQLYNISDWQRNSDFYPAVEILLSIKSFDLAAIRQRYLQARKNLSGKGGSVERRAVSLGGLAQLKMHGGKAQTLHLVEHLKEPRGLSSAGDRLAFSLENRVIIIDENGEHSFSNPWFSYIHTVAFHPLKKDVVLVSSSGFDALFEYHYPSGEKLWEWFAWENGLNKAHGADGEDIYLTRSEDQHLSWQAEGLQHLYISNPEKDHLPTAQRAAFINTASYDAVGNIQASLFHEGSVRSINRQDGSSKIILKGLKFPHGGFLISEDRVMATNTGKGELWIKSKNEIQKFIGDGLANKASEMGDAEWWQNAVSWGDYFLVIDSNRNSIIVLDPKQKQYDLIAFDANWAVQDLVILNGSEPSFSEVLEQYQAEE